MAVDFVSTQEIILAARKHLAQGPWDYLVGGSESETTMRRNRLGFDRIAFRPRILVDVSHIDPSGSLLGHALRIPVLLAPIGSVQAFDPAGAVAATRAAAQFGTIHVISSGTEPRLEETAAATPHPKIFQLYVNDDWPWVEDILGRVKAAGYVALCLTVDNALYSHRERPMLGRYLPPSRRDPPDALYRARLTWESMDRIREIAGLPFLLKGVATPEDAVTAVEHGAQVIWVSNHGGRQLDQSLASIDMLPEIFQAVAGRAQIVVDGGIQRGSDVLKAIGRGANAVAIGKLQGWGLGASGTAGLVRVLELLEEEMVIAMGLLGVTRLDQLTPAHFCPAEPVMAPHEMSQFPGLPGGQVY